MLFQMNPGQQNSDISQGLDCLRKGSLKEALNHFDTAIKKNPYNLNTYSKVSKILQSAKKKEEAIQYLKMALDVDFNFAEAYFKIAKILEESGTINQAIIYLTNATYADPSSHELLTELANMLQRAGRYEEAIQVYKKLILKGQVSPTLHNNLGFCYRQLGKIELSIKQINKAIIMSQRPIYFCNRAEIFSQINKEENCIADLNKAIQLLQPSPEGQHPFSFMSGEINSKKQVLRESITLFKDSISHLSKIKPKYASNPTIFNEIINIQRSMQSIFTQAIKYMHLKKNDTDKGNQKYSYQSLLQKLKQYQ